MAWYNVGTVTVTNGSTVVTGAGTDFINNVSARDSLVLVSLGTPNEIASVDSKTQLTLARPWLGATTSGATYFVQPTVGIYVDLALRALNMLVPFQAVIDGIGQGLVASGTNAAPGVRFAADQDTGFRRAAENVLSIVAGGVDRIVADGSGATIYGTNALLVSTQFPQFISQRSGVGSWGMGGIGTGNNAWGLQFNSTLQLAIDISGNLLVGTPTGDCHTLRRPVAAGQPVLRVQSGAANTAVFYGIDATGADGANAANAALKVGSPVGGRSIATTGTINANGADYAEYMTKANSCGTIAAGDVCGVDIDGKLTRQWGAAISFVVKSTDPALVGGDIWAAGLSPKPEAPGPEPIAPGDAPIMPDDDAPEALATWRDAAVAHTALVIAYPAEHAAWSSRQAEYDAALEVWEVALETARQCVDRIAFCGQVPVNVTGDFTVGDYIIAVANGSGIEAVAVAEADITFEQYRRRIGKVWAVREGRAWVDVQHG